MTGKQFEEQFISTLSSWGGITPATQQQDTKEGTDFFYYGVRVDITVSDNKDNTTAWKHYKYNGFDFNTAIRTGNKHQQFEVPTLVIQISSLEMQGVLDIAADYGTEILEEAIDHYWNTVE